MKKLFFTALLSLMTVVGSGFKANKLVGTASYYANSFSGRKTSSGERFSQNKLTAASNHFTLGDTVLVTNINTGQTVYVRINDRMGISIGL